MTRIVVALVLALCACSSGRSDAFSESQRIVDAREIYAAAVDPALPDAKITAAAKSLCKIGTDWCMVVVVPNGTTLPSGFPLSDAEVSKVLGFYTLNRTSGTDEFKRAKTI